MTWPALEYHGEIAMGEPFDPYYKWLGIPAKDQPPTYYRLLSLESFESDPDVIESAADRAMAHLRSFQVDDDGARPMAAKASTRLAEKKLPDA